MRRLGLAAVGLLTFAGCFEFDVLVREALCRTNSDPSCPLAADGGMGGTGGGMGGGASGTGGGAGGGAASDAFTDGGLMIGALARAAAGSSSRVLESAGNEVMWMSVGGCGLATDAGTDPGPQLGACARSYVMNAGTLRLSFPSFFGYVDVPLGGVVSQEVRAYLGGIAGQTPSVQLNLDPRNTGGLGGFSTRLTGPTFSGASAWQGTGKRVVSAIAGPDGLAVIDATYDGGTHEEDPAGVVFSGCTARVDDAVTALDDSGGTAGAVLFSVSLPVVCGGSPPGVNLVRSDGPTASFIEGLTLDTPSLRLASSAGHVWGAGQRDGGGFDLHRFSVGSAFGSELATPWRLPDAGDWRQADVAVDDDGRPYLLGDGTLAEPDGGTSPSILVASFELDGGLRFVLPLQGSSSARAVAASWTSRGLAIAGDCDADAGLCSAGPGAFLAIVRVPR